MKLGIITLIITAVCHTAIAQERPQGVRPEPFSRGRGGFVIPAPRIPAPGIPAPAARPLPSIVGKTLSFEVLIAGHDEQTELPTASDLLALEKAGKLGFASRLQLMSVESEPARVQLGALTPRLTGRTFSSANVVPIYSDINIGTLAEVTGRIGEDGSIIARVAIERSAVSGGPEGPFDPTDNSPAKNVERIILNSTVRLTPGEPQLIGSCQMTVGNDTSKTWIVVTGRVLDGAP